MDHTDMVKARIEQLRLQKVKETEEKERKAREMEVAKEAQRLKEEAEYKDAMIDCEARTILYLETLTDEKIINDFTEDKTPETYIADLCKCKPFDTNSVLCILTKNRNDGCMYCMTMCGDHFNYNRITQSMPGFIGVRTQNEFKIKKSRIELTINTIKKYVMNLITPIHKERERNRKEKVAQELKLSKQKRIDEINSNINTRIKGCETSFIPLTLDDYPKLNQYEFVVKSRDGMWYHYGINNHVNVISEIYNGKKDYFIDFYDEGKVPFLTRCPTCKCATKFNYLNTVYPGGGFGSTTTNQYRFVEVYCKDHYWYDTTTNKHYVTSPDGLYMEAPKRPNIGSSYYQCWNPTGYNDRNLKYVEIKWKVWDPNDPDGKKAAEQLKNKQITELEEEINKLRQKLNELQNS